jgi:outer membrane protein assembly factor BamB
MGEEPVFRTRVECAGTAVACVAGALWGALPSSADDGGWHCFGRDQGRNRYVEQTLRPPLRAAWRAPLTGQGGDQVTELWVVTDGDTVYAAGNFGKPDRRNAGAMLGSVWALDAATGEVRWHKPEAG